MLRLSVKTMVYKQSDASLRRLTKIINLLIEDSENWPDKTSFQQFYAPLNLPIHRAGL